MRVASTTWSQEFNAFVPRIVLTATRVFGDLYVDNRFSRLINQRDSISHRRLWRWFRCWFFEEVNGWLPG